MSVLLTDMIAQVRVDSGLRGNPFYSDQQIAQKLTDGIMKLRDIFIASLAHWFRRSKRFTLEGGVDGSAFDLSLIPDFQMDQYLNRNPDSTTPEPVTTLGSIAERTFGNGVPPGWVGGRKYDISGDFLTVYPFNNSSGDYELFYTSMGDKLALPITREFDIDAADTNPPITPSDEMPGPGFWSFANGDFNDLQPDGSYTTQITTDGSGYIDTDFSAGPPDNTSFNGRWFINGVSDSASNEVSVTQAPTGSVTGPAAGTATITYQPVGTVDRLPQILTPWESFVKLWACILIRQGRRQPIGSLMALFEIEEKRAIKMAKTRTEGVKQAPMTHNRIRRRGYNYGSAQ